MACSITQDGHNKTTEYTQCTREPVKHWLSYIYYEKNRTRSTLECGPMSNVRAALPNIGAERRKVWLMPTARVPCSKAANTG